MGHVWPLIPETRCYHQVFQLVLKTALAMKYSEDIVSLGDLKVNPGSVIKHASQTHRPVLLTSRGRAVAVVQSVADFEKAQDERDFMRAVLTGMADIETGRVLGLAEARARLGLD